MTKRFRFKPEDFKRIYSHIEDPFSPAAVDNSKLCNRISAADVANALLEEYERTLPVVYGRKSRGLDVEDKRFGFTRRYLNREMVWSETGFIGEPADTHRARLWGIEEIKNG